MSEPGQKAYEAWIQARPYDTHEWADIGELRREAWAAVEATIFRAGQEDMQRRAVEVVKKTEEEFLSPKYAANQPLGSFCERFACEQAATAIASLEVRDE